VDTGVDLTADFHEYGVEWTAKELIYTFDGRQVAKIGTPPDAHKPMYMLINLAVGGKWPELPDASTRWPARLEVDWVRVYRRAEVQRFGLNLSAPGDRQGVGGASPPR
jgi:beta-glucanase (GH16 family)